MKILLMLSTTLVLVAAQASPEDGAEECLRMAFGEYCLGGPVERLPPKASEQSGRLVWIGPDSVTMVHQFEGRAATVGRSYNDHTWLKYRELLLQLSKIFGEPLDRSEFPAYADDETSRENAISLGKGRAQHLWPDDGAGYAIMLTWHKRTLMVMYRATALATRMLESAKPQF